jgi:hypothetical protein
MSAVAEAANTLSPDLIKPLLDHLERYTVVVKLRQLEDEARAEENRICTPGRTNKSMNCAADLFLAPALVTACLVCHQAWAPARPFPSSIFLDKNRRDIGKSQSIWTDSKMETAGSHRRAARQPPSEIATGPWEWPHPAASCFPGSRRPARPFPSSIFLDKNRRDIGKSQSTWTAKNGNGRLTLLAPGMTHATRGCASGNCSAAALMSTPNLAAIRSISPTFAAVGEVSSCP